MCLDVRKLERGLGEKKIKRGFNERLGRVKEHVIGRKKRG